MTTSSYMPDAKVEIAFNAGYATPAASRTWTDVSQYVELAEKISILHGRSDELATADPNRLTLTLDNTDGRFTAGYASGAYYPNVKIGRPIRVTVTPVGGSAKVRFLGYVEEWPVEWSGSDRYASASIVAMSRMARLGLGAQLESTQIENEILNGQPVAYWPMTEAADATQCADLTGREGPLTLSMSGNAPTFGSPTGPGGEKGVKFSVTSTGVASRYLKASIAPITVGSTAVAVEGYIGTTAGATPTWVNSAVLSLRTTTGMALELTLDGSNGAVTFIDAGGAGYSDAFLAGSLNDGSVHHVRLEMTWAAGTTTFKGYVDGVQRGTSTAPSAQPIVNAVRVGGLMWLSAGSQDVTVSHVAVGLPSTGLADRAALVAGDFAEPAADRIGRYARWAGVPTSEYSGSSGTHNVDPIDTDGKTALEAMRVAEATEGGVLYDAADGTLTYKGRDIRYNTTAALSLSASAQQIGADIAPKLDRSALVNDVTATVSDGSSVRYFDQASINDYGYAKATLDLATSANEGYDAAAWRVSQYATPAPRIPSMTVDLLAENLSTQTALLATDIGTRLSLTNMPSQAPASTLAVYVEGYTETIGAESYAMTFNVSRADGFDVFVLDDATKGVLDSTYPLAY